MAAPAAYDLWAETYPPSAHNPLMQAEQAVVMRRLATIRSTSALDVGTGTGRCVSLLQATGARRVIGIDLSMGMLTRNSHRERVCANALHLPLPSSRFDLINASLMAGDIDELGPWIGELARVLMPGGQLIYSDFHPNWDQQGWQRTFRTREGEERVLPRASHALSAHFAALEAAGLDLVAANEVKVSMRGAGLKRLWRQRMEPVAMVFHARKDAR